MNSFEDAITNSIYYYYDVNNISYHIDTDFLNVLTSYLHHKNKQIEPYKRKVYFSAELENKIKTKQINEKNTTVLYDFKSNFELGKNMNGHLSKQIYNSDYFDKLLITWGIRHLHLNIVDAQNRNDMSNNRSELLLFCVVTDESVYFLDIERHNKEYVFSMFNLLEIISNNWAWLLGEEIKDIVSLEHVIKDDKSLYELRKSNINVSVLEINGKLYISPGKGLTLAGTSSFDVQIVLRIRKALEDSMPSPPLYVRDIKFELFNYGTRIGTLSWMIGSEKKQIVI